MHKLHFGDNLSFMQDMAEESVDLIYLDPPFNSKKVYNVIVANGQAKAFDDTWSWDANDMRRYERLVKRGNSIAKWTEGMLKIIGSCGMLSYLYFMAERLIECRRLLKNTGSIYLHCDDAADYHLRCLMDAVFGWEKHHNTIHWKRTTAHSDANRFGRVTDTIIFYGDHKFNAIHIPYSDDYIRKLFNHKDERGQYQTRPLTGAGVSAGASGKSWKGFDPAKIGRGRHWAIPNELCNIIGIQTNATSQQKLDQLEKTGYIHFSSRGGMPRYKQYLSNSKGVLPSDMWFDIGGIGKEYTGYATQKPEALLERIIKASSNEGDVVFDPFCGSGTTVVVAAKLGRIGIGCDLTFMAIDIAERRLQEAGFEVEVSGEPQTFKQAEALAMRDKFQFQAWVLNVLEVNKIKQKTAKKGKDSGVDGVLVDVLKEGEIYKTIVSVKGGRNHLAHVRDLIGTVTKEKAQRGVLACLYKPTKDMITTASMAGIGDYDEEKCVIICVPELIEGKRIPALMNVRLEGD